MKHRRGDRYDGRWLRTLSPFYQITPFIMRTRSDAQDYYEDQFKISPVEKLLRSLHDRGFSNIGFLHVFMAAAV
ncbi:hypothetical protein [Gracilinema caldarium]|uniref:hypothetical protein n=1 Tax=Gracilinema caldarium TaxID=215591 RepID=UPI0026EF8ED2|nr:hypothetical protein [Gracilinema caldarium]